MEVEGEHGSIRWPGPARGARDHGRAKVVSVNKLGGAVATTASGVGGVEVYGWSAAVVILAVLGAAVFVIWWVLSDSDRSSRLKEILLAIFGSRP